MRTVLAVAATALAAYSLGRAVEWRAWRDACEAPTPEPEDGVQPPDPVTLRPDLTWTEWVVRHDLLPLTPDDRDWLSEAMRSRLLGGM